MGNKSVSKTPAKCRPVRTSKSGGMGRMEGRFDDGHEQIAPDEVTSEQLDNIITFVGSVRCV